MVYGILFAYVPILFGVSFWDGPDSDGRFGGNFTETDKTDSLRGLPEFVQSVHLPNA